VNTGILVRYDVSIPQMEVVVLHMRAKRMVLTSRGIVEAIGKVLLKSWNELAPNTLWEIEVNTVKFS